MLDHPALRRPGRLDVEIEVPVPDDEARADILRFHLSQLMTKEQMDGIDFKVLARTAAKGLLEQIVSWQSRRRCGLLYLAHKGQEKSSVWYQVVLNTPILNMPFV